VSPPNQRLSVEEETAIIDRVSGYLPEDAARLHSHLREVRNDQWMRSLIEKVVAALTENKHSMTDVVRALERLEKTVTLVHADRARKLDPMIEKTNDLLAAEILRQGAETKEAEAREERSKAQGEGLKAFGSQAGKALTSPPFMLLWGGLSVWALGKLGVVVTQALQVTGGP
jgi:hypothetical protein